MKFPWSTEAWTVLIVGGIAAVIGTAIAVSTQTAIEVAAPACVTPATPRPSAAAERMLQQHFEWAEAESQTSLELEAIREFFQAARLRTRGLAKSVLGWESKWKLAGDYVTGGTGHDEFLQAKFEEFLFTEEELTRLVEQAVDASLLRLKDIDSEFLLRLQQDLETLPRGALPAVLDRDDLRRRLREAIDQCQTAAQADLQATMGIQVASCIAGDILAASGTHLAVSAGLIGAGASTSWATLGIGIAAAIAADYAISEYYQYQFDPIGKLDRLLTSQLDSLETLILQGTVEGPGLKQRLQEYVSARNSARRSAIQQAVLMPSGQ